MSILIIIGAATLLAAPFEVYTAHKKRPRVKVYRKPDQPKRHRKSPSPTTETGYNLRYRQA